MSQPAKDDEVTLIYDGECPVCSAYSAGVAVQPGAGGVRRVDARSSDALVAQATAAGLDLDEGMVVVHRGKLHHGAEALHLMATLAPATGFKNRLNRWLFGSLAVSRALYPFMRAGRNTLLWLLGKTKIRNLSVVARKDGA